MLKDEEIDELIQPIINLYSHIEEDLIVEIAKRFENADEVKGSLEWQLKKLEELGGVNSNLVISKKMDLLRDKEIEIDVKSRELKNLFDLNNNQQAFNESLEEKEANTIITEEGHEPFNELLARAYEEPALPSNTNKEILTLHDEGLSEIEIAKKLGKGLGEVKFVLGLYKEGR